MFRTTLLLCSALVHGKYYTSACLNYIHANNSSYYYSYHFRNYILGIKMSLTTPLEVFETYYHGMISLLPMRDPHFILQLQSSNLLPAQVETALQSLRSSKEKASYFLDNVIKPELCDNVHNKLDQLLILMMDDSDDDIKQFAYKVKVEITPSRNNETQIGTYNYCCNFVLQYCANSLYACCNLNDMHFALNSVVL